jgi:hypothetical protein
LAQSTQPKPERHIDRLTIDDLAPVDEFHSRRRRATEELGRR